MHNTFENTEVLAKVTKPIKDDGEVFRQGDWLCRRAPETVVAHGADGSSAVMAKKGSAVCSEYAPILEVPPLFHKGNLSSTSAQDGQKTEGPNPRTVNGDKDQTSDSGIKHKKLGNLKVDYEMNCKRRDRAADEKLERELLGAIKHFL